MGDLIVIREWKKQKLANKMWTNLKANGYNVKPLQQLWKKGELFFASYSEDFPVTIMSRKKL